MFEKIKRWRQNRIIKNSRISQTSWEMAIDQLPLLHRLSATEVAELKKLAILLLHEKDFSAAGDLTLSEPMRLLIALQACLPVLHLGLDWYTGWHSIIVYPQGFVSEQSYRDEFGVMHRQKRALSGEAWRQGPVILSWDDVENAGQIDGDNLVIHEFAHKIDMRNGIANGFPPLHKGMNTAEWSEVFSSSFADFQQRCDRNDGSSIDCYAAHSPAEFFSVFSEVFFEHPEIINTEYPDVYRLMSQFYRQDTLASFNQTDR